MHCYHLSLEASRHPLTENKNKSKIRKQKHFFDGLIMPTNLLWCEYDFRCSWARPCNKFKSDRHLECNENDNGAFVVREGTLFIPNEMHMFSTPHRSIITFISSELPSCWSHTFTLSNHYNPTSTSSSKMSVSAFNKSPKLGFVLPKSPWTNSLI